MHSVDGLLNLTIVYLKSNYLILTNCKHFCRFKLLARPKIKEYLFVNSEFEKFLTEKSSPLSFSTSHPVTDFFI